SELIVLECRAIELPDLLQLEVVELAEGFHLGTAAAAEGPGRSRLGREVVVQRLEFLGWEGGGGLGPGGRAAAVAVAPPPPAAAAAAAPSLRPDLLGALGTLTLQQAGVLLLGEFRGPVFYAFLQERFDLITLGPVRLGREDVRAEGRLARAQ